MNESINAAGGWAVFPPLITIFLAVVFRKMLAALAIGVLSAVVIREYFGEGNYITETINQLWNTTTDVDSAMILVLTLLIVLTISLSIYNGGMMGLSKSMSGVAKSRRGAMLSTYVFGLAIFFDDYANSLVVGNTMRPIMDKFKVSREKLAYIVDSTAAPVVSIAIISTWVGYEVQQVSMGVEGLGVTESAFSIFLHSVQYSFYPLLTLVFVLAIILTGRDYGPMKRSEEKAKKGVDARHPQMGEGLHSKKKAVPIFGTLPIVILIVMTLSMMIATGSFSTEGEGQAILSMLIGSLSAFIVAMLISIKVMKPKEIWSSLKEGFKGIYQVLFILILAWTMAGLLKELQLGGYLMSLVDVKTISPISIPLVVFILSAVMALATGSSFTTMAFMYGIAITTTWQITEGLMVDERMTILYYSVSSVLAGAVFGDHCSPISDTTIMSSAASSCHHLSHVKTQLPYALTVGGISLLVMYLSLLFSLPFYGSLTLGAVLLLSVIFLIGKK